MKKTFFIFLFSIVILSACSPSTENIDDSTPPSTPSIETPNKESGSLQGNIEEVNEVWNRYTNRGLGFSIEYPKLTYNYGADSQQEEYQVEVTEAGNVVYLSTKAYEQQIKEQKGKVDDIEKASGIPFAILVQDAKTDAELEKFIQDVYGKNCKLGEKKASDKPQLFEVSIDSGMNDPEDPESCFVNYITKIKYNPEKGKVAAWDIGQDSNFYQKDWTPLDEQISESFTFL